MKFRVTMTCEYEPDPSWYPDDATPEEMADIDRRNMDSIDGLLEFISGIESKLKVQVEPIED